MFFKMLVKLTRNSMFVSFLISDVLSNFHDTEINVYAAPTEFCIYLHL